MQCYLITGAAGFIGSNLVEALLNNHQQVVGFDNLSTGFEHNLDFIKTHPNRTLFKFIQGDSRDLLACKTACNGIDFILHQAALGSVPRSIENPLLYNENNITGTLNMLIAAHEAKAKRFVFASSSSVYGDTPILPKVESMIPTPKSPYAVGKLTGEQYCRVFYHTYGLPTIALRYFNVFGPRQDPKSQYAAVIPKFIRNFLDAVPPVIFGDGEQTRDFTYIDNVITANLQCCNADSTLFGTTVNIGCGQRISINLMADQIQLLTGSSAKPIYQSARAGDVRDSLADITLAKTYLGLASPISLDIGLKKTVDWFTKQPTDTYMRQVSL